MTRMHPKSANCVFNEKTTLASAGDAIFSHIVHKNYVSRWKPVAGDLTSWLLGRNGGMGMGPWVKHK